MQRTPLKIYMHMLKLGDIVAIGEPVFAEVYIKGSSGWQLQKIDEDDQFYGISIFKKIFVR